MTKTKFNIYSKLLPYLLLAVPVLFNAITLAPELSIKADPNDNIFHFALTNRMNEVVEESCSSIVNCPLSIVRIVDHWVPNWASGYNLPYYYQHLPHLFVVSLYQLLLKSIPLYQVFNLVKYLLWVAWPISIYLSAKKFGFGKLTASLAALFGSQMLTDGLYGADISSFAWRGYGISTQLYALFFAPLALGQIYDSVKNNRRYWLAVLYLSLTFASHLAIGYLIGIAGLFVPLSLIRKTYLANDSLSSKRKVQNAKLRKLDFLKFDKLGIWNFLDPWYLVLGTLYKRLTVIYASSFLLLSYWFIPLLTGSVYHSISFWDPPVKWNSYGAQEIIRMLISGQIFDFNRPAILTLLFIIGFIVCLYRAKGRYLLLGLITPFFLVLYFGRTTWGTFIDLLPQMKEMHQQRLVNGLQLASVYVIGIGAAFTIKTIVTAITMVLFKNERITILNRESLKFKVQSAKLRKPDFLKFDKLINWNLFGYWFLVLGTLIIAVLAFPVYRSNWLWLKANSDWLQAANKQFNSQEADLNRLVDTIKQLPPGRVYAGRPGNWGRQFQIGVTQMYLALSTRGIWLNSFLPESWSLNSEIETFFNDQNYQDYQLYNVRYIVAPSEQKFPDFARLLANFGNFYLYQVDTTGFFDLGTSNLLVETKKENITNIHHLWVTSELPAQKEFPTLLLAGKAPDLQYTTRIEISDTYSYRRDSQRNSLYSLNYNLKPEPKNLGTVNEIQASDHKFMAEITADQGCNECLVILKSTYHPNWQATVDGQKVKTFMVFPSFAAVKISPGSHTVEFKYQPSGAKMPLMILGLSILAALIVWRKKVEKIFA